MAEDWLEESCKKYDPDTELNGAGNVDYGHNLAEAITQKREMENLEKIAETEDAREFVETVNKHGLNPDNIFSNSYEKAKMLQDFKGYKTLKTKGQNFKQGESGILISRAKPERIGSAFKSTYYSELKRLNKNN